MLLSLCTDYDGAAFWRNKLYILDVTALFFQGRRSTLQRLLCMFHSPKYCGAKTAVHGNHVNFYRLDITLGCMEPTQGCSIYTVAPAMGGYK